MCIIISVKCLKMTRRWQWWTGISSLGCVPCGFHLWKGGPSTRQTIKLTYDLHYWLYYFAYCSCDPSATLGIWLCCVSWSYNGCLVQDHTGFTALTQIYHSPVPQAGTDAPRCPSGTHAKSSGRDIEEKIGNERMKGVGVCVLAVTNRWYLGCQVVVPCLQSV